MQIAFIHPRYPFAEGTGATHSATQIVTGLANNGHDVCVYCTRRPEKNSETGGLELRYLGGHSKHPHTNTRYNKEVVAHLDELREFDIVHSYLTPLIPSIAKVGKNNQTRTFVTLNAYAGICAKNDLLYRNQKQCQSKSTAKCGNCILLSGSKHSDNGYLYQTAGRLLSLRMINTGEQRLENIDGFQALSPHIKQKYSNFGYEDGKIQVIPNILDRQFEIEHESDFEEPFRLLYVGSLENKKGIDRIINIFSLLYNRKEKDVRLTIIGDGSLRTVLEKQATEQGVSNLVEFRGQVPNNELPSVYAAHDIFMYPGRWDEPFGRVFLEAMAAGTPIVATDVGSIQTIIDGAGITTNQNVSDFVSGIESILSRKKLCQFSTTGKNEVKRFYCSEVIRQFEQLYQDN